MEKVKGELKSYDSASSSDNNTWANGIKLGYKTDSYKGLKQGTTSQSSTITSIDDTDKQNKTKA